MTRNIMTIILTVLFAVTMISCTSTTGNTTTRTISVSGNGEIALSPDMASFSVSFSNTSDTTREAQQLTNEAMQKVYDILMNEYGVTAEDMKTTSISLYPKTVWRDGESVVVGQTASQSIDVKVYDLTKLGAIVDSLSEVTGVEFSSIQLGLKDKSEAMMQARIKAMDDAMAKAADYADASGMTLGKPVTISDSNNNYSYVNFAPVSLMARSVSADAAGASASYYESDVKVTASVSVVFEMN